MRCGEGEKPMERERRTSRRARAAPTDAVVVELDDATSFSLSGADVDALAVAASGVTSVALAPASIARVAGLIECLTFSSVSVRKLFFVLRF